MSKGMAGFWPKHFGESDGMFVSSKEQKMGNGSSENRSGAPNRKTSFDPARYGMGICPDCKGNGYVQNSKRQCCLTCGGFGFIKKELEKSGYIPRSS